MNKPSNPPKHNSPFLDPNFVNPAYPVDSQAERAVIACLLDSPGRLADAWHWLGNAEVMGNQGYRAILNVIQGLCTTGKSVKLSSVIQHLNQSGETRLLVERGINLIDLPREATAVDLAESCSYLRGLWVKRLAIDAVIDIQSSISGGESVDRIADKAAALHETISTGLTIGSDKSMRDYVSETLLKLDEVLNKPGQLTGVNTGSGKLNKHLGGWQSTDVIMLAGRPGMGKSVAGVFHAEAAASGDVPVAFLSLEMPARSLINRLIAARTGIPYGDIKKGNISLEQTRQIHQAAGEIERLPIHWYDDYNRDINDLTYKLLNWKRKYGIGLVIIDYVQLITDRTVRGGDEYKVLTEVSKKLQQLRKRLDVPVIELAQLNRSVEDRSNKRPGMHDLRSTGQFEQDASLIIMLYRPDYYAELAAQELAEKSGLAYSPPTLTHRFEYGIVKNRDGYTGTVVLHADVALNQVFDSPLAGATNPQTNNHPPKDNFPSPADAPF
jgi:replicative DNA helicase